MAVNFSESMTKENLMRAFAGESQARNRYTIAAERAEEDGMLTIAEIFRYTADQERAHAERFYDLLKELSGETIHIDGSYPVDQQDTLPGLLRAAEHNEHEEFSLMSIRHLAILPAKKDFPKQLLRSIRLRKLSISTNSGLQNWRKCWNPTPGISRRQRLNGCVPTVVIYTRVIRHRRYALYAGMRGDTLFLTNWHATGLTDPFPARRGSVSLLPDILPRSSL